MDIIHIDDSDDNSINKEWAVEKIVRERIKLKKNKKTGIKEPIKEYLVKWLDFATPSWEPESNLENCQEVLRDFLDRQAIKKIIKQNKMKKSHLKKNLENIKNNKRKKLGKKTKHLVEETSTLSNSNNINGNNEYNRKNEISTEYNLSIINKNNKCYKNEIPPPVVGDSRKKNRSFENGLGKPLSNTTIQNELNIYNKEYQKFNKTFNRKEYKSINSENNKVNSSQNINNQQCKEDTDYLISLDEFAYCSDFEDDESNNKKIETKIKKEKDEENEDYNFTLNDNKYNYNEGNYLDNINNGNNLKILEIYNVQIPNNFNEKFKLNVKYEKNNKIYINEIESTSNEIPKDYLINYYEEILFKIKRGEKLSNLMTL